MARALIVGCGCRGRALGAALVERGWLVRGTTRDEARLAAIEAAGIEPALADPDRAGTVFEQIVGVGFVFWLMGSARGGAEALEAINGPRLERLLEKLVDTPVRGFVYEGAGSADGAALRRGAEIVAAAGARWRIPFELVATAPGDHAAWRGAMVAAAERLAGSGP
jgi:nucleoside-diphosphate-sugar epimerase